MESEPCSALVMVVSGRANQCSVRVGGKSDAIAEASSADLARRGQLAALLQPSRTGASEHPCATSAAVAPRSADKSGSSVARESHAESEKSALAAALGCQFGPLSPR